MTGSNIGGTGDRGGTAPPRNGTQSGGDKTEKLLRTLAVKLNGLAVTDSQREVMHALHAVVVMRVLRHADTAVTIRDAAARTGLHATPSKPHSTRCAATEQPNGTRPAGRGGTGRSANPHQQPPASHQPRASRTRASRTRARQRSAAPPMAITAAVRRAAAR